ncbi:MAG: hypothetical protein NVS1B3_01230 [Candidatus Dormibacteraceae bacterium]
MPEYGPPLDLDRSVTLRQLRTFKAVADLKSFSLAALSLRLSQPWVSYQVKELEVAPVGHAPAGRRGLKLKELEKQPFVMREPASGSRWSLEKAARKSGAKLDVAIELSSNGAIKHAVESGLGLAVLSRYACALELPSRWLIELDVRGFPIRRDWHIVHLRRRRLPASVVDFVDFLKGTSWLSSNRSRGRLRPPTD